MSFSPKEILNFIEENDVKFIRLTFCDMFGNLKNVDHYAQRTAEGF